MPHPNKAYLGDGAYVQEGSFRGEVVLTTEDGISVQNQVVLGPTEIRALLEWMRSNSYTDNRGMLRTLDGERSIFDDVDE